MLRRNGDLIGQASGAKVGLTHVVDVRDVPVPEGVVLTRAIGDVLAREDVRIIVETIGGTHAAYEYTKMAMRSGRHVVTSNKELVSSRGDELLELARENRVMYLFEASVGGGIPVLKPIELALSGNRITRIDGIVNGSTNYLLTRVARNGLSFSAALGEARALGYVEEDPAADVEGWDARRKLAILAHMCFGSPLGEEAVIPTEGISSITEADIEAAGLYDMAVKLIAHAERDNDRWHGWVHPSAVSTISPLYDVSEAYNAIIVHGDFVDDVMFYGLGAGSHPTASAVIGDIVDIAQNIEHPRMHRAFANSARFTEDAKQPARYLTRLTCGGELLQEVNKLLPGVQVKPMERAFAILTPLRPQEELEAVRKKLAVDGISRGVWLRVLN